MQSTTIVLLFLAIILSFVFSWFQYFFKKKPYKSSYLLAFLRFLSILVLLVLLINPKYTKNSYALEKANLSILIDNSSSIGTSGQDSVTRALVKSLTDNEALLERFQVKTYSFSEKLNAGDSLSFDAPVTDIAQALSTLSDITSERENAILLLSDGNQTRGTDYEFQKLKKDIRVYPVVLGDTTDYEDLRIGQVNYNKYAFLKNQFPIEFNINYSGRGSRTTNARLLVNNKEVYRERLSFTAQQNNVTKRILIEAGTIGFNNITVVVDSFEGEKNKQNNAKALAIEVVDERTNITIVSSIKHPDIGMLKKSIESNEQRAVIIVAPDYKGAVFEETDIFLFYQPNRSFLKTYDFVNKKGGSLFTITGPKTDWDFLNQVQESFIKEDLKQTEAIFPVKNAGFGFFDIGTLSFEGFPPLETGLGEITISKPYETMVFQRIKGTTLDMPLMVAMNDTKTKEVVLFGEGIWKWRVETYRNEKDFAVFDDFIGKTILYLADSGQKNRLELNYELIYDGIEKTSLKATYYDEAYVFDATVNLTLKISKSEGSLVVERPMLLKNRVYEADLSDLDAGDYTFSVEVKEHNIKKSGQFTILDFDLERQFLSADNKKLKRLADRTQGELFYPAQKNALIEALTSNSRYTPVQKSTKNIVSLIDFRWLLTMLVLTLATEWFIRKYNGLL